MTKPAFNLDYHFGADLKEVPKDPKSMQAYVDFLIGEVKLIAMPPVTAEGETPAEVPASTRALVKFLGEIGAYAKILKKPDVAIRSLEQSLALIEKFNMGAAVWAVHTMRYGDALRFQRKDLEAETAFFSVLELSKRHPSLAEFEDFVWQHLGKLRFDQGEMKGAEEFFKKALEIRKKKGVPELINSTELALRVLMMKKSPR